ncbi:hypothetical protein SAMN02745124_01290 [Desulfofustis glycolicus DSM 9705]|uniref:Uncharacterized protein n=1 Tax=Desulfofustis glycolicus DSM 9705 TaxID=1121409 RepID=A0A1M5UPL3_9BACT|nr:hypothetical protein SAMN02745124_01290 [Desulfofustis glycolicus DSM 9705]
MALPENIKQFVITDTIRVKVNLDSLGMVSNRAVTWGVRLAPGVSNARPDDALDYPELGFGTPKSAQPERCSLEQERCVLIDGRYLRRINR